jgi:predicted nucleotidyltransferase component of viral defense system
MLTLVELSRIAAKRQTRVDNTVREYVQSLLLSSLYRFRDSEHIFFKGGTALRLIFQSPRFSEDLDFTGYSLRPKVIVNILENTLVEVERSGVSVSLSEAKTTTGGYLGILIYDLHGFKGEIRVEISLRIAVRKRGELTTIIGDYTVPYTLLHLPVKDMVYEKIQALLRRGKPRDYYDLYFILRHPDLNRYVGKENLCLVRKRLSKETFDFRKELKLLLPVSHHGIIRNFKDVLKKELDRYP